MNRIGGFILKIKDGIAKIISGKKGRFVIIAIWIVVALGLQFILPNASTYKEDTARDLSKSEPSVIAEKVEDRYFEKNNGIPLLITWSSNQGLSASDLEKIQELNASLQNDPIPNQNQLVPLEKVPPQVLLEQRSKDKKSFIQTVIMDEGTSSEKIKIAISELEKRTNGIFRNNPFETNLDSEKQLIARATGPAGISVDASELFKDADVSLLIATVCIVLLILLLIYRSPILALIPLIAVGMAYLIVTPILGFLGKEGIITYSSQGLSIMTVLLFGAGTDYCLFLISRYRHFLKIEQDRFKSLRFAFRGVSGAILLSGLTVMCALLLLLATRYGSFHNFAIPFSLAILVMLLSSLTLVPALLGVFGRVSFWPFIPHPSRENKKENRLWDAIGRIAIRYPIIIIIFSVVLLGMASFQVTQINYSYDTLSSFPDDMPSKEGFRLIEDHFGAGYLAPLTVIVKNGQSKDREALQEIEGVKSVSSAEPSSKNKSFLKYSVILNENPYSKEAMNKIPKLKQAIKGVDSQVYIAGQTATQFDERSVSKTDEKIVIPLVIVLISVLLLFYLRSIVAMIYLVLTVLFSYTASLGMGWLILHYFFEVDAISGLIPLYAFIFIVALGEDYNIFMVSSIWENAHKMPISKAVREGVHETGGVITSAGVILAATFLVLTTLPIELLVQFGLITALGILVDTFLIRPLLVPALTVLLGKWAFWPGMSRLFKSR